MNDPHHTMRHGVTLTEIVCVVAMMLALSALLTIGIGRMREQAARDRCGHTLRQLMAGCIVYGGGQERPDPNPAPWSTTIGYVAPGTAIAVGVPAMEYAFGCLEVLAVAETLPNSLFACPSALTPGPTTRPTLGRGGAEVSGHNWADEGGGTRTRISYAFDWAAPADPSAARVIFSDRDPITHHNRGVMACYGDSHAVFLSVRQTPDAQPVVAETIGMSGDQVVHSAVDNPSSAGSIAVTPNDHLPDDIFSSTGDYLPTQTAAQTVLTPYGADATRAFVK